MKMTKLDPRKTIAGVLLYSLMPITTNLYAEEAVEDTKAENTVIVVTAQRREQNFQDVAMSMSALTGDIMEQKGIDGLEDLVGNLPGITVSNFSLQETSITLRGISPVGGSGAPIAVYLDEMPITGVRTKGQPAIKTFDVNRIEVLRGPQGTLYGEGSLGGTIKVIMNKPDATKFASRLNGSMSSIADGDTSSSANLMINVPLIENELAIRGVFQYRNNGGFIDAPNQGKEDVNSEKLDNARLSLKWFANEQLTIDLSASIQNIEMDGRNRGFDENTTIVNPYQTNPGTYEGREMGDGLAGFGEDQSEQYNVTFTYNSNNYQFVSSSSYYERDSTYLDDASYLNPVVNSMGADMGGGFNLFFTTPLSINGQNGDGIGILEPAETRIFTQEFRVSYEIDEDLFWTAGVFYKNRKNTDGIKGVSTPDLIPLAKPQVSLAPIPQLTYDQNTEPMLAFSDDTFKQTAIFGELTYHLTDKLTGTIGGRYFKEDLESNSINESFFIQGQVFGGVMGATGDPFAAVAAVQNLGLPLPFHDKKSITESTWKVNLSYDLDENSDHLIYGTVSTGFRTGGVNVFALAAEGLTGMPIGFLPRTYSPDTVTNYEIGNKSSWNDGAIILNGALFYIDWEDVQVFWDPTGFGFGIDTNAGTAHTSGIELEGFIKVSDAMNIDFGIAYTNAELDQDVFNVDGSLQFNKGARLGRIPKQTLNLGVNYTYDNIGDGLQGVVRANYSYMGDRFTNPSELEFSKAEAYSLVDLSFSIISDNDWSSKIFVSNLTDEDRADLYIAPNFGLLHQPRTIGVSFTIDY